MDALYKMFRKVILLNELDGNLKAALRFSDPDGVRSGKSGWSFGVSQFDTQNNDQALKCLAACGFTQAEIKGIVNQTIDVKPLNPRLAANADVIEVYDTAQLAYCVNQALSFTKKNLIDASKGGILALGDYVNQYGSLGEQSRDYYKGLGREVRASNVLDFKLAHTKYGREHPADCRRRYANIVKVVEGA